jgi:fucose 4-O-acetylase-like acetyltransferase
MQRRSDIDNLRSAATYLLVGYHVAKVFDGPRFYHLKNQQTFVGFDVFAAFVRQWHMPLFFVLAGWSTAAAFDERSPGEYRMERARRLLVPLAVWSVLLGPPIRWVELKRIDGQPESFGEFLPTFFTRLDRFSWSHLWFLAYLFTFSMLYLPLFRRLHRRGDVSVHGSHLARFVAVLVLVQVALRWMWPGFQNLYNDWANFTYYSLFFVAGFLIGRFPSVDAVVDENRWWLACIGAAATAMMLPFWLGGIHVAERFGAPYILYQALSGLAGAGIVGAVLAWARRHFVGTGPLHHWAKQRAFPTFVLHQIAVVAVAVHVVDRPWALAWKFAVTLCGATALTLTAAAAVARIEKLHPLFGMPRTSRTRLARDLNTPR